MRQAQAKRLRKLISFLESLPRHKFNFAILREVRGCRTVACALGWTPELFPDLVAKRSYGRISTVEGTSHYSIATMLFGLPDYIFMPYGQHHFKRVKLKTLNERATPQAVAEMLKVILESYNYKLD